MRPLLLSLGLYLAACALPALTLHNRGYMDSTHWVWSGYQSVAGYVLLGQGLLLGWLRLNFTAFANVPLWIAWFFYGRKQFAAAQIFAAIALVVSLETFQLCFQPYLYDEGASVKGYLAWPHAGYFCWIASMAVIWLNSRKKLRSLSR